MKKSLKRFLLDIKKMEGDIKMVYEMLRKQVIAENETYCKDMLEAIEAREAVMQRESTQTRWEQYQQKRITYPELVEYTSKRIRRKYEKMLQSELELLEQIAQVKTPYEITIYVNWVKNPYWGNNPHAEVRDDRRKYFGSASGCGYDKQTAAIAEAANQSLQILKILCDKKEIELQKGGTETNRNIIGYGSGNSAIPKLEGGVGISSFRTIFENCGYKWDDYSGEKYDMYIATKKEN